MKILLSVLLVITIKQIVCNEWVDPHDMNTNAKEKYVKPKLKKSSSTSSIDNNGKLVVTSDLSFSHLKRILNVLVNSAHIDKRDPTIYHGHIRFDIDPDDFDFLMKFGNENFAEDKLRRLDTIFTSIFKRTAYNEYLDEIELLQLRFYTVIMNVKNLWILGALCLLYVIYQLFKNNFSFAYILKYLIIVILICDFGFRYHSLLEEAEEHNLSIAYSTKCDPSKMSWREWTQFWFSSTGKSDCQRKVVTPLDAFLYQVKNLIIVPMHALGTGMGGFGYNMFTNLPWGLNLIMWPLMLVFVIIVVVFTMVVCTGQPIEFNIFHVFKLKFGGARSPPSENVLTGPTVERLMDGLHRPMVQNITVSVPSGTRRQEENTSKRAGLAKRNPKNVISSQNNKNVSTESSVRSQNEDNKKSESNSIKNQSSPRSSVEGNIKSESNKHKVKNTHDNNTTESETNLETADEETAYEFLTETKS